MSFMERSNWKDPNKVRKMRILIPIMVGLLIAAVTLVEVKPKFLFTAAGTPGACPTASGTPTGSAAPSTTPTQGNGNGNGNGGHHHWPGHGRGHWPPPGDRHHKGAEAVTDGVAPAAAPGVKPPAVPPAATAPTSTAAPSTAPAKNAPAHRRPRPTPPASNPATPPASAPPSAGPTASARGTDPTGSANPTASAPAGPTTAPSDPSTAPSGPTTTPSGTPGPCPTTPGQPPQADPNMNCTLTVPANPLSARGLATPYRLSATDAAKGPCNEANINQSAFVQATILDPATGKLSVYNPLVIDQGSTPAAAPARPKLPAGAVVGIWFGFDATNLTQGDTNGSLQQGKCVNGLNGDVFGQFSHCNAVAFFAAANRAIKAGKLKVPALGTAKDGGPCLSTRDFALIDQDQSDNVTTQYLATADGKIAQNTAANRAKLGGAQTLSNPSDNALLDIFVDPAMGCTPWTVPNLGDAGTPATSLALDELQAAAHQAAPSALVPENDPMVLVNNQFSRAKTNLYRAGVDQPPLPAGQSPATYCRDMNTIQAARLKKDLDMLTAQASPMPAEANSLFTFLGMRLQQSFGNLNCQNFGLTNPVSKLTTVNNVITAITFA